MIFSIVIPVYNVSPVYFRECVDSILSQSYSDFEIILIDDGSTDGSGALCDKIASNYERIKVIHKENGGVSSARNEGIAIAKGEWLLFCDADDTLQENCLELIYQIVKDGKYDLYKFHYNILMANGRCQDVDFPLSQQNISSVDYLKLLLRHKIQGACWGYVYRTQYVKQIKFNNQLTIGEDSLFVMNYLLNVPSNVHISSSVVYNYRNNPESVSKNWVKIRSAIGSVNKLTGLLFKQYSVLDECRTEYNTFVVQNLIYTCIWKLKLPSKESQQLLIGIGDNYCENDVGIIMKRYILLLRKARFLGNIYLMSYYGRYRLLSLYSSIKKGVK